MSVPVTKNLNVLDIRDFGAVDDAAYTADPSGFGGSWAGTDNAPAIIAAINAARPGQPVFVPDGNWLTTPIPVFNKLVPIWGAGRFSSRLIAHIDSPAGGSMFTIRRESPNPPPGTSAGVRGNHQHGMAMRDLFLDGNGRNVDIRGVTYDLVQHTEMMNVEVRHFARQGILGERSVRECYWWSVQVRNSGDSDRDMPGWDMRHTGTVDAHNNLWMIACESSKNFGYQFAVGSNDPTRAARSVHWVGGLIHGSSTGSEGATNNWYGYADPRLSGPLVQVRNQRGMHFSHVRFHEAGGADAMIDVLEAPALVAAGTPSRNTVSMSDCEFGTSGNGVPLIDVQSADRIQISNCTATDASASVVVNNPTNAELLFSGTNEFIGIPSHNSPDPNLATAYWDDKIEAEGGYLTLSPNGNRWLVTVTDAGAVQVAPA